MQVDVKEMAEIRVFAIPHIGPYPQIEQAFQRLHEIASMHSLAKPAELETELYVPLSR